MRIVLKAYHTLGYFVAMALFGIFSATLNVFCWITGGPTVREERERYFQRCVHRAFRTFVWWLRFSHTVYVRYEGAERWPVGTGLVVAANHPGLMDAGWLLALVPEAFCIYRPDLGHHPLFGATARHAGYLPSDQGLHLLRTASAKIAAGGTLLVFPEGTRSRQGELNPLKPGFVAMARLAHAPIQLVHIRGDSPLLAKGQPWWRLPQLPVTITVALGPCLPPPEDDTAAVLRRIEAWFRSAAQASQRAEAATAVSAPA